MNKMQKNCVQMIRNHFKTLIYKAKRAINTIAIELILIIAWVKNDFKKQANQRNFKN